MNKTIKKIALERIYRLFWLGFKYFNKKPELSDYYASLAWKISLKYRIKIPLELKQYFCRKCHSFLVEGKNSELIKVKKLKELSLVKIKCFNCKNERLTKIKKLN